MAPGENFNAFWQVLTLTQFEEFFTYNNFNRFIIFLILNY